VRRILFVDDEPKVLEGLGRVLRGQRGQWDMVFANGGEAAQAELEKAPFDVIVSDMRMPGIDGATLLARVQRQYPGTVRIVLSGQTELVTALLAVPIAHHFLTKPCDAATLRETIERACNLRALLHNERIVRIVGEVTALPSLPRVYAALTRALADGDVSLRAIAGIVEQDSSMCAKVIHLANSGFFGSSRHVTSIQGAIGVVGTAMLRNLVLSAEVFRIFDDAGRRPGFSLEALQRHVRLTAAIAMKLLPDQGAAELAYLAGILYEIGQLVLATHLPDHFARLLAAVREQARPLHMVEAELGEITHAEIGAYLLASWGLPYPVVEAAAHHHAPRRVSRRRLDVVAAVHIADCLAHEQAGRPAELDPAYLEALGVVEQLPTWRALAAEQAAAAEAP
jgi:HD-like signal output (HDOD) protein